MRHITNIFSTPGKLRSAYALGTVCLFAVWATCFAIDEIRHRDMDEHRIHEGEHLTKLLEQQVSQAISYADTYLGILRFETLHSNDVEHTANDLLSSISLDPNVISSLEVYNRDGEAVVRFGADEASDGLIDFEQTYEFLNSDPNKQLMLVPAKGSKKKHEGRSLRIVRPIYTESDKLIALAVVNVSARALSLGRIKQDVTTPIDARIVDHKGQELVEFNGSNKFDLALPNWPSPQSFASLPSGVSLQMNGRSFSSRTLSTVPLVVQVSIPLVDALPAHGDLDILTFGLAASISIATLSLLAFYRRTIEANAATAISESRFRDFTNASSDWMWEMDSELRFTFMSEQIKDIIGRPASYFIGRSRQELAGDSFEWSEHARNLRERKPFRDFVYSVKNTIGNDIWINVSGIPVFDENGAFEGYRGTGSNITDMVESERQLKKSRETLEIAVEQRTRDLQQEIAERKIVEDELRRSEDLLRDFGAAAADWYWEIDESNVFTYVSPEYKQKTGVPSEGIIGQVRDMDRIRSAGESEAVQHLEMLKRHEPFRNFVRLLPTADGSKMWISANGKPIFDAAGNFKGYRGTSTDITDQLKDQERLTDMLTALERMPEAVAVLDEQNHILFTNQVYREFNSHIADLVEPGAPYVEVLRSHAYSGRVPSAFGREEEWLRERISQMELPECSVESQSIEGHWHRRMEYALPSGGRAILVIDITNEKSAQEELLRAKDEAVSANKAKSDFLSRMSHELRTPLNAILGFSQTLAMDPRHPLTDRQKESVSLISSSGNHLLDLIGEVLELSQIEAGKLELKIDAVSPTNVILECIDIARGGAEKRDITFDNRTATAPVGDVLTDQVRLKQILLNLISNAVKYNPTGGRIVIDSAETHPDVLRISVSDTGPGIDEKYYDRIFEPFDRLGKKTEDIEGTGIGLALSKQLADVLGCVIGFNSKVGAGSTFWIELPMVGAREAVDETFSTGMQDSYETQFGDTSRNYRILYVEDNRINIQLMQSIMTDFDNIDLAIAINAETGIEMANEMQPDVILMDIGLPGINGIDAVKVLKAQDQTQDIPVIAVSAAAMPDDLARAEDTGFIDYLTKPLDIPKALSVIESAVMQHH